MLPEKVKGDVKKYCRENPFATVQDISRFLRNDIATEVDERVASALRTRKFQDLPGYKGGSRIHALQEGKPEPAGQSVQAALQPGIDVTQLLQKVCSALE